MNLHNNINLGNDKFDGFDSETIDHLRFMAWWKTYKQHNHGKKDNQRINVCSMASNKMVGLVYERRWAKRNKTIFDWWKVLYHIKGGKTSMEDSKN